MLPQFIRKWEEGYKIVLATEDGHRRIARVLSLVRRTYYNVINSLSEGSSW